jgi:hypothetical protein
LDFGSLHGKPPYDELTYAVEYPSQREEGRPIKYASSYTLNLPFISSLLIIIHLDFQSLLRFNVLHIPFFHRKSVQLSTIKRYLTIALIRPLNAFQMASKKVLVVFGATGIQGGSVVKAVLGDAKMREAWIVRGVTRDVSKPSAKALESLGAETVAVS